ncbi:hypothetical protein [Sinomonas mesophila]|uniref:hypothetical protein n=1 Tax=Sinomonas mesophila TaxID=1531955 RepID=UPI0009861991|nr:hypothetical protein [Sinomonas mesophila]
MTWLAWTTFAVALVLALVRVPAALRGENRLMLGLFALFAAAILLSIGGPYVAIDSLLGGINLANLLLRFIIYGVCLLLAVRVSRAFAARGAEGVLLGPWGLAALAVVAAGTVLSFLLMNQMPSSVGLSALDNDPWFDVYAGLGRIYPTFTGVVLLPSLFRSARGGVRGPLRAAAGLLGTAYVLLACTNTFVLMPTGWTGVMQVMNYGTLLLLFSGLAVIWIAAVRGRRRARTAPA